MPSTRAYAQRRNSTTTTTTMAFRFLDPGILIDRELELIAPDVRYVDDVLAACNQPVSASVPAGATGREGMNVEERGGGQITRQQLLDSIRAAPNGRYPADNRAGRVPAYHFWMRLRPLTPGSPPPVVIAGTIGLRIGSGPTLELYFGHIGYNVFPPARGHHYAERSCRLLFPLARAHGMRTLWITCNPDNWASRRTCERLGGAMAGIVDLPPENVLYQRGERQKCRYRIDI